jgi:hypothetical protein
MAALAAEDDFWSAVHTYRIRAGYVTSTDEEIEAFWYVQCAKNAPGAEPAWIATRKAPA